MGARCYDFASWDGARSECVSERLFHDVGKPFRSNRKAGQGGKMKPRPGPSGGLDET